MSRIKEIELNCRCSVFLHNLLMEIKRVGFSFILILFYNPRSVSTNGRSSRSVLFTQPFSLSLYQSTYLLKPHLIFLLHILPGSLSLFLPSMQRIIKQFRDFKMYVSYYRRKETDPIEHGWRKRKSEDDDVITMRRPIVQESMKNHWIYSIHDDLVPDKSTLQISSNILSCLLLQSSTSPAASITATIKL